MRIKQSPPETWIAFVDLLGTKDSAKIRKSEYPSKIGTFNRVLSDFAKHLSASTKVRFFSDCAYIECDDYVVMFEFLSKLRWALFSNDIFFKGAITRGALNDVSFSENRRTEPDVEIDISGSSFGPSAVSVYYAQENFKGVGFLVDAKSIHEDLKRYICESCFPLDVEFKSWISFHDLRFQDEELGSLTEDAFDYQKNENRLAFFDGVLTAALRANTKGKNLSRYYMSCIMTAIQSSDFSKIRYFDDRWMNYPLIFFHILLNPHRRANYSSLKGSAIIFLSLVSRVFSVEIVETEKYYQTPSCDEICDELVRILDKLKILNGPLKTYPASILSPEIADEIGRRAVAMKMQLS